MAIRKNMRKNRKSMRKTRKSTRKTRRTSRRNNRNMYGGALTLAPMELTDTSMMSASKMSGAQGLDFLGKHSAQHGGGALMGAPVGETGMLDAALRASARMTPLDASYSAAANMKDQSGGRRKGRKGRKSTRKTRTRKGRKSMRKSRRQNGGMAALGSMEVGAPGTLLSGAQAGAALSTMNKEWALAENPSSFAPKLTGY
jgi:hypothetical protein